jgi:adenine nucleotide transporter 17
MQRSRLSTLESMAAGALAGSATVLITNPIWVVNTRMTARKAETSEPLLPAKEGETPVFAEKKRAPNTLSTFLKIIREDGPTRLFAGVLPALVLVINPILQYTIFEQLKQVLEKRRKVTATDSFLLGALGKLAATSITYPYITVKSRAHVATGEGRDGMTASLKRIVREEGVAGLYGGMSSTFLFGCLPQANIVQVLSPRSPSRSSPPLSCLHSRMFFTMPLSKHAETSRRRCRVSMAG